MVQCNLLFQFIFFSFHLGFPRVHCTSCLWFVVANFWQKKRTGNQSLTSFGTASKIQCHIFSMLASSKETNQIITVFYWKVDIATPLYQSIKIDMHRTWEDSGHLFHSPTLLSKDPSPLQAQLVGRCCWHNSRGARSCRSLPTFAEVKRLPKPRFVFTSWNGCGSDSEPNENFYQTNKYKRTWDVSCPHVMKSHLYTYIYILYPWKI